MTRDDQIHDDPRVVRTRNLIVEALIELTVQKGFAAVTVHDIVKRAGINRATFYRHYQDKFDLLNRFTEAVYQMPGDAPEPKSEAGEEPDLEKMVPGLARLLEYVRQNAGFFRVMLGQNGDPAFAAKIRRYIQKRIRRSLPAMLLADEKSADLFLSYISSGSVGVLLWWLEHDTPYTPEHLAAILSQFIAANLASLRQASS